MGGEGRWSIGPSKSQWGGDSQHYSRMAFMSSTSLQDLKFEVLIWAIGIMGFHKMNIVIIFHNDVCVVNVVTKPRKWPSFKPQSIAICRNLKNRMVENCERRKTN